MKIYQENEKDISKVFTFVRAQLQAKEKELLELQRANPCLLAPDFEQIDVLLDAIACLQLSIQDEDGSFVFASNSDYNDIPSDTSVYSADSNSIKTLPSVVWLPQSAPAKEQYEEQPSIFNHLLSLPSDAYLASSMASSCETTTATKQNQSFRRNSMFSHLLCLPIDSFKSSPNTGTSIEINNNKKSSLTQEHEQQPSIFNHLLSLPNDAYLASSWPSSCETTTATKQNQSFRRNSMFNHLLCMSIDSFKSSPNTGTSIEINNNKNSSLTQEHEQQPSIFNHLLSLPSDAYLASSIPSSCETTTATKQNQSFRRNSMFNHLFCMPINSFKSSSNTCASIEINNNKNSQNNVLPTTEGAVQSVLNTGMDFSKEFWLRNSRNAPYNQEIFCYA